MCRSFYSRIENLVDSALTCLLWTDVDPMGNPLDDNYYLSDIEDATVSEIKADLLNFARMNQADLNMVPLSSIGHDFILTRNGHGAGFWDRGYGALGERLTKSAKTFGSITAEIGDDGKIYAY
jgi:hypothetical protein